MNYNKYITEASLKGCTAIVIADDLNCKYISGFGINDGILVCFEEKPVLFLDKRYVHMENAVGKNGAEIKICANPIKTASDELCKRHIKKAAIDSAKIFYESFFMLQEKLNIKFEAMPGFTDSDRRIKTAEELEKIKAAQKITDQTFETLINKLYSGMKEQEIAAFIEYNFKLNGAEPAFDTIAVSGANSASPHGIPLNRRLEKNSFLIMDFGAKLDGYCSDMTRTVAVGDADDKMNKIYNIVLEAQEAALAKIKAGVSGAEIDAAARNVITKYGYAEYFTHSTGHGVGLEIHESPSFSSSYEMPIPCGSVLSVEPGVYIPGKYGVRIEDIVSVTENGCENLTKSEKNVNSQSKCNRRNEVAISMIKGLH